MKKVFGIVGAVVVGLLLVDTVFGQSRMVNGFRALGPVGAGTWTDGQVPTWEAATGTFVPGAAGGGGSGSGSTTNVTMSFSINGGDGNVIPAGFMAYAEVPASCTIYGVDVLASPSGSAVVEVMQCTYAQFDGGATHPVSGDKITASAPPTISSATKSTDSTLTGWTTSLVGGRVLAFSVTSATTVTNLVVQLKVSH